MLVFVHYGESSGRDMRVHYKIGGMGLYNFILGSLLLVDGGILLIKKLVIDIRVHGHLPIYGLLNQLIVERC